MDMEGARSLTYFLYAYGKPRLSPVHKYSSLRSTAHRATVAAGRCRDPEGSARNSCNSWPLYARWANQRAWFGYLLQLLRALPQSMLIN